MVEFQMPLLFLLQKIFAGKVDVMKSTRFLRENGNIFDDAIIILDDMYLQQCEEYCGGETFGSDKVGELYTRIVCFMIIELKNNILYMS